ncbi:MAG: DUF4387 domain-containing protein [Rhodospirillales bacterium]|jgi:hypothetical protein
MAKLGDLAKLVRSKNAGPFYLTFDVMFDDPAVYERVKNANVLSRAFVAERYGLSENEVMFFYVDNALAVKASIPRPIIQGDVGETDSYGGQQFAPLLDIEIP